jgi:hypothetical protein
VECVLGIIKKRWMILDYGIRFNNMLVIEKVFTVCCILHNSMLTKMESRDCDIRVGRGVPLPGDGVWFQGDKSQFDDAGESLVLALLWGCQRAQLGEHVHDCAKMAKYMKSSFTYVIVKTRTILTVG